MAKAAKNKKVTDRAYVNLAAELNSKFGEEIVLKEHCRDLIDLSQVFEVSHDRQNDKVENHFLIISSNVDSSNFHLLISIWCWCITPSTMVFQFDNE